MTGKLKRTTYTTLVLETLVRADDLMTCRQIADALSSNTTRISTALCELLAFGAVEKVEAPKELWWFATPQNDRRTKVVHERTEESKPRRKRRKKETSHVAHHVES